MQQNTPWEAKSFSDSQEIPGILLSPKIHYFLHISPPLIPIRGRLIQSTPTHPYSSNYA